MQKFPISIYIFEKCSPKKRDEKRVGWLFGWKKIPGPSPWTRSFVIKQPRYLEAVAAMPQLFLFRKTNRVQPFISHFLAGQVTSKAFALMFWVSSSASRLWLQALFSLLEFLFSDFSVQNLPNHLFHSRLLLRQRDTLGTEFAFSSYT